MKKAKTTKTEKSANANAVADIKQDVELNEALEGLKTQAGAIRDSMAGRICFLDSALRRQGLSQETVDKLFKILDRKDYDKFLSVYEVELEKANERKETMKKKAEKKVTEGEETTAKKATVKAAKKSGEPKVKKTAEKGRFGHRKGSSADFMDDLLFKGCAPDAGAKAIADKFEMELPKAKAKLLVHVRYLKAEKGVVFCKFKDGIDKLKTKTETL